MNNTYIPVLDSTIPLVWFCGAEDKLTHEPCRTPPQWIIWEKPDPHNTYHACTRHVGELLTEGKWHEVYPISAEFDAALPEKE